MHRISTSFLIFNYYLCKKNMFNILLIATGLSIDSFAVSVASGTKIQSSKLRNSLRIALFLSVFQGVMPVMGWIAGNGLKAYIAEVDHWIAFILLTLISAKMIYEGIKSDEKEKDKSNPLKLPVLIGLSIATSIDALVVGISFALLSMDILISAIIIGLVTFLFSFTGLWFSIWISKYVDKKIEVFGGLVLFGIGLKILLEHTVLA